MTTENNRYRKIDSLEFKLSPMFETHKKCTKKKDIDMDPEDEVKFTELDFSRKNSPSLRILTSRNTGYVDCREQARNLSHQLTVLHPSTK